MERPSLAAVAPSPHHTPKSMLLKQACSPRLSRPQAQGRPSLLRVLDRQWRNRVGGTGPAWGAWKPGSAIGLARRLGRPPPASCPDLAEPSRWCARTSPPGGSFAPYSSCRCTRLTFRPAVTRRVGLETRQAPARLSLQGTRHPLEAGAWQTPFLRGCMAKGSNG